MMKPLLLVIAVCIGYANANISTCKGQGQVLVDCIIGNIDQMRADFRRGVPERGIPSLEPISIDKFDIDMKQPDFHLKMVATDIMAFGASYLEIERLIIKDYHADITLLVPYFTVVFNYATKGSVYKKDKLNGKGRIVLSFRNATLDIEGDAIPISGAIRPPYVEVISVKPQFSFQEVKLKIDQTYKNTPSLKLAEYARAHPYELVATLKPVINDLAGPIIKVFFNKLLAHTQ